MTAVFAALDPIQKKIRRKGVSGKVPRPWVDSPKVPLLKTSVSDRVFFPDPDEEFGHVHIGWHGPVYGEFTDDTALSVLWDYLTESSIAPLKKIFVEISDPYCTDLAVVYEKQLLSAQIISFDNVPVSKLDEVESLFVSSLREIVDTRLDMDRVHAIIDQHIVKARSYPSPIS